MHKKVDVLYVEEILTIFIKIRKKITSIILPESIMTIKQEKSEVFYVTIVILL